MGGGIPEFPISLMEGGIAGGAVCGAGQVFVRGLSRTSRVRSTRGDAPREITRGAGDATRIQARLTSEASRAL